MELIEKYKWLLVIVGAVLILGGLLTLNSSTETLTSDKKSDDKMMSEDKNKTSKEEEEKMMAEKAMHGTTSYTAKAGDSYTKMARKAVQDYDKAADSGLSRAQVVAAETFLTVGADSPYLEVGQKVNFDSATVAKAVKKAQALNANQVAAWQVYVPYVNFDTSHIS